VNAPMAYLNGAGLQHPEGNDLDLLNTLLSTAGGKSEDERQSEEESKHEPISKPGGFQNDPNDPSNPNEVRERFLRKIDKKINP
jgi:hypothetical protein